MCAGVQGIQVEELWSLDKESFDQLKYVLCHNEIQHVFITYIIRMYHGRLIWYLIDKYKLENIYLTISIMEYYAYICSGSSHSS